MKKTSVLLVALLAMTFASCEKETTITVNMTWTDSEYVDLSEESFKIALYKDAINFIDDEDYDKTPIETKDVVFEAPNISLNASFSSYQNFTAVLFADLNDNEKYDKGENADIEFTGFDAGEEASFELEMRY